MPRLYQVGLLVSIYILLNILAWTFKQQENMIGTHIFGDSALIIIMYASYRYWRMVRLLER